MFYMFFFNLLSSLIFLKLFGIFFPQDEVTTFCLNLFKTFYLFFIFLISFYMVGFYARTTTRTTEAQPGWTPRSEKNVMLLTRIAKHTGPVKRKLSSAMIVSYRISTTAHSAFRTSKHRFGFRPKSICRHHPHHSTSHIAHGQSK